MGRRRRRSIAGQITSDAVYIANRAPWQLSLVLGAIFFVTIYWVIPAVLIAQRGEDGSPMIRDVIGILTRRYIHWFEYVGIALGVIFGGFAIWNYLGGQRVGREAERGAGLVSRLLGRWLD